MQSSTILQGRGRRKRAAFHSVLATLITLTLGPAVLAAEAGGDAGNPPPAISVTGEGKVTAQPDRAALQLGVQVRHEDLAEARSEVTRRSNAILQHLASLGIEERHVNATDINTLPEYRWDKEQETQVLTGYSVQRSIDLALMDLSLLSTVIEGSADAGANRITPPRLSHSREAELRRDALRLATEDARANARAIAETLGGTLGAVRDISTGGSPRPVPMARDMMMRASAETADADATYVAGDQTFEARVSATFNLATTGSADGV
ncbi:SIMPL domain-containing protein [Chromatocurvus halotolerans]|uniref:Secreted protein n=1 Tax=Chromatocurvus halotolerans TaxID=1132028 RepID=A0A4R2L6G3_9GAMM|nr:SIMPL domain-containing protein [Chromatocurvus halotolerans]TCO78248.1 hypothetical protein EV688_10161 [Chromatocurvus halotolerans]